MEAAALQIRFHDGKTVAGGSVLGGPAEGTRRCPTSATITFLRRESSRSISPGMKPYFPLFKLFISAQNCASFAAADWQLPLLIEFKLQNREGKP